MMAHALPSHMGCTTKNEKCNHACAKEAHTLELTATTRHFVMSVTQYVGQAKRFSHSLYVIFFFSLTAPLNALQNYCW